MAIVTRYFSTTSAGAADGTTWADRAELFSAGNWSTVITGFNFSGADSLKALIGPGTYTCSQALAVGLFTNAPSAANPVILHACDASGVLLAPPNPDWTSDTPFVDTGLPVIATTTNFSIINLPNCFVILLKFTASGITSSTALNSGALLDWCSLEHGGSSTGAIGIGSLMALTRNCSVKMTSTSYRCALQWASDSPFNCRLEGVIGTSGNRHGAEFTGSSDKAPLVRCTIFGFGGDGVGSSSTSAVHRYHTQNCVIANNGGTGLKMHATALQTAHHTIEGCMITGNGAWGIDGQSAARALVLNNRLRDNASGNITGLNNYPIDLNNDVTDATDGDDYTDAPNGDFRIKASAAIAGKGYGVSQIVVSGGSLRMLFLLRPFNMSRGRGR